MMDLRPYTPVKIHPFLSTTGYNAVRFLAPNTHQMKDQSKFHADPHHSPVFQEVHPVFQCWKCTA